MLNFPVSFILHSYLYFGTVLFFVLYFLFTLLENILILFNNVQSIFRKPKECKERHNVLMDSTAADGADSAEDSGSSQPYPSTLPGIPKVIFFFFVIYFSLPLF